MTLAPSLPSDAFQVEVSTECNDLSLLLPDDPGRVAHAADADAAIAAASPSANPATIDPVEYANCGSDADVSPLAQSSLSFPT